MRIRSISLIIQASQFSSKMRSFIPKFGGLKNPLGDVANLVDLVADPQDEVRAVDDPRHVSSSSSSSRGPLPPSSTLSGPTPPSPPFLLSFYQIEYQGRRSKGRGAEVGEEGAALGKAGLSLGLISLSLAFSPRETFERGARMKALDCFHTARIIV